ncbi:50S ribosomal protein L11 methyltransferase [Castellaniella daejeonensis]|jgi:ribosomal protein L11 methyltransferase|uniref:Ribosomal protein L11 methyltransferase n=1 Tax=Castellaniella daejeonensis TaxID=659013 RepID=A0ABP3D6L4_9BURK|nr:50S ribosomal protein L11 methyltransferase [Castellaniella sp.]HET8704270.1 50S ribosomal protein L11 methyltransferase [Castellaniella sp.]
MRELVLNCVESQAEAWSDALLEAGALSVSVEDADGDTEHEQALFGEPGTEPEVQAWRRNRLVALLADGDDPAHLLASLDGLAGPAPGQDDWFLRDVPDADWVRLTQSQFGPIVVSERIWIVPSWHRDDAGLPPAGARDGIVRIELDPGLAFGTGSHPTTHLCLEWLAAHLQGGETVLDYGCGSGILAIAARLLGAGPTQGVDIDEQAVLATARNAAANGVDVQACLPDDLPAGTSRVVVANILSNPLKILAPMLAARVAPGGWLALSGVLERQADEVCQAYAPYLPLRVWEARDGWVCLTGRKA